MPSIFTPAERVAVETIPGERPEVMAALAERLTPVLDDLAQTCEGLLATRRRPGIFLSAFSRPTSSTGRWMRRAPGR
jgi:hypothetical protein